jgi:TolB-like protein/DNA-binding response OmpR family regulator
MRTASPKITPNEEKERDAFNSNAIPVKAVVKDRCDRLKFALRRPQSRGHRDKGQFDVVRQGDRQMPRHRKPSVSFRGRLVTASRRLRGSWAWMACVMLPDLEIAAIAMTFAFAECELDPARQELRRAGEVIHVEPQVFKLLLLLVENRDRIVSKDEILDAVWDGRIVSEAALSSRINAVRRAIGDNGNDQALVRTLHKRGFRFVGEVHAVAGDTLRTSPPEEARRNGTDATRGQPAIERSDTTPPPGSRHGAFGEKPSIAVMPFANLSADPSNEYFSYGLTEDIIRLLARNRWLTVLSRHSTVAYRDREIDPREIGAALGVRYLVQGTVQKTGEHVRIGAELVSTDDGSLVWSDLYEMDLPDIFDIQNAMAQQIAAVIEPELGSVERLLASRKVPANLNAWDCYQRGLWHLWAFTNPGFADAETFFRRAIELEPGLARAHAGLSYVHLQTAFYGDPKDRPALLQGALLEGKLAVALDERDAFCHHALGRAHSLLRNYAEAVQELELTIELNPSFAQGYFALGFALTWCGREDEAISLFDRAAELSPRDPHLWTFYHIRALAHLSLNELKSAEFSARKSIMQPNAPYWPYATLVATLGLMNRPEDAAPFIRELLARRPGYNRAYAHDDFFFCDNDAFIDKYVEGLRRAGVPA